MYAGVVGIVLGLSKYHAASIGDYDFTNSSRFGWAAGFISLLCLMAYGLGLPEVPRTLRSRIGAAIGAASAGAFGVSAVQLIAGDTLLPRFVVFGSAVLVVPWFVASSALAGAGRSAQEQRDRVVVVGPVELGAELQAELSQNPERPASILACLSEREAGDVDDRRRPLVQAVVDHAATVVVLSGAAQADERIVDQAAALHESGVRVRTQSLFLSLIHI